MIREIEAGRDNGNDDVLTDVIIDGDTVDDIDIISGSFTDVVDCDRRIVDRDVRTASNVDDRGFRAGDLGFKQRGLDRFGSGFLRLVFTLSHTDTDQCRALASHDCADIREVQVDECRNSDQVSDGLNALT